MLSKDRSRRVTCSLKAAKEPIRLRNRIAVTASEEFIGEAIGLSRPLRAGINAIVDSPSAVRSANSQRPLDLRKMKSSWSCALYNEPHSNLEGHR